MFAPLVVVGRGGEGTSGTSDLELESAGEILLRFAVHGLNRVKVHLGAFGVGDMRGVGQKGKVGEGEDTFGAVGIDVDVADHASQLQTEEDVAGALVFHASA